MLDAQDRSYLAKLVLGLVCGVVVAGVLMVAGFQHFFSNDLREFGTTLRDQFQHRVPDTPIVLIGDSLIIKSPDQEWTRVKAGQEYSVVPAQPVTRIARKKQAKDGSGKDESGSDDPDTDDPNPATDLDSQSLLTSWTINLFTADSPAQPVVTVALYGYEIHLTKGTGFLCEDSKKRIRYGASANCSDKIQFTRAEITPGSRRQVIKEDCVDATYQMGTCKFVLDE